jgi:restriction endonuclease
MKEKNIDGSEENNSEIKKEFNCESLLKNIAANVHSELNIEISSTEQSLKAPEMFSIWIESRKKLNEKERIDLIDALKNAYFCSSDEINEFIYDLENTGKIKIAVLPKIYTSNFLKDLKEALKDQSSNLLINLNEYSC